MKKLLIPIIAVLLLTALTVFPTASDMEIYGKVVRLHVIANSDSDEDQALKLKVRDGVLATVEELTRGCKSKAEAERVLTENSDAIKEAACRVLNENGSSYSVSIEIGEEKYPTRDYGSIKLPAGKYCSVRVKIGEADGKNWWCVLFPPLCTASATEQKEELLQVGFTPDQVGIITESSSPKYKVKFKILEIIGKLFS